MTQIENLFKALNKKAKGLIIQNNNFVHDWQHTKNVIHYAEEIAKQYQDVNKKILITASYWHDVGRYDYIKEEKDHALVSYVLLEKTLNDYEDEIISSDINKIKRELQELILKHRNRKSTSTELNLETQILWDSDKLDIFNLKRLNKITKAYSKGNYSIEGEFNYLGSLLFWNSINANWMKKFHTKESKKIFQERYPSFEQAIQKYNKQILNLPKILISKSKIPYINKDISDIFKIYCNKSKDMLFQNSVLENMLESKFINEIINLEKGKNLIEKLIDEAVIYFPFNKSKILQENKSFLIWGQQVIALN